MDAGGIVRRMSKRKAYPTLAAYVAATGVSQVELATRLGIRQPQLSRIMRGKRQPSFPLAMRIVALTGVPVASLVVQPVVRRRTT